MADFGDTAAGIGVNMGIGRGVTAIAGRLPVPLPSFYNGNSQHPFRDSQANRMLHGDTSAMRHYAGKGLGGMLGQALIPIPYLGALAGSYVGNKIAGFFDRTPNTSVGGQPATTTSESSTAGDTSINPWTGAQMPNFSQNTTGSQYGPMSDAYRGSTQPSNSPSDFVMPDFSHYGDLEQFDAPPKEKLKERMANGPMLPGFYGVSNFMANGQPVITGFNGGLQGNYNRAGGSNQGVVRGRDPGN